ncbi:CIC11C00000002468 [Sungouiella intermedia]|uniref:CIC11C00000002468 n=1 Tax=Sungouiella intermedia TaxID=45354 RepID=A0A1L0DPQ9_9ASCO|nr:CIC11C00000002468 [[Candida] intermedia]
MLSRNLLRTAVRFQSTLAQKASATATGLTLEELAENENAMQAPNRESIWSPSQAARRDIISKNPQRFIQKDLSKQPQPYAAIELIAQVPVKYLHEGNIAVCDGNRGSTLQGHPKVFINLDQPKPATCGYCGLRYAKEEFREIIEKEA